jgi:hypothetical protein
VRFITGANPDFVAHKYFPLSPHRLKVQHKTPVDQKTSPHVSHLVAEALRIVLVPLLRPTLPSNLLGELLREERETTTTTTITTTVTNTTATTAANVTATPLAPHGQPPPYPGLPEVCPHTQA